MGVSDALLSARRLARQHKADEGLLLLESVQADAARAGLLAEVLALRCEMLLERWRLEEAARAVAALEDVAPERALLERCWLDYYCGEMASAARSAGELSGTAFSDPVVQSRRSLAIGKVCSDAGWLNLARLWLVDALRASRDALDLQQTARSAGAIGEVLFLGGRPLEALDMIQLDSELLQPGSTHAERLMTYRAHVYRQTGSLLAAISLYEEATERARLRGYGEAWPLRGRLWCLALEVAAGGSTEMVGAADKLLSRIRSIGEIHSLGHALMGMAWLRQDDELLREARAVLEQDAYTSEAAWIGEALGADVPVVRSGPPVGIAIPAAGTHVCDEWLVEIELEELLVRRRCAQGAFRDRTVEGGRQWMGCFF